MRLTIWLAFAPIPAQRYACDNQQLDQALAGVGAAGHGLAAGRHCGCCRCGGHHAGGRRPDVQRGGARLEWVDRVSPRAFGLRGALDGGGVKDEPGGFFRVTLIDLEASRQRLVLIKGDDGQQRVAGQRKIPRDVDASVAMIVLPPMAGVALVMIEVFDAPMPTDGSGDAFGFAGSIAMGSVLAW